MQDERQDAAGMSRRAVLASAVVLGVTACGAERMSQAEEPVMSELEIANETLVNNFCRDWSLRDVDALAPYLADDLLYQITPGQPLITSLEQFSTFTASWYWVTWR